MKFIRNAFIPFIAFYAPWALCDDLAPHGDVCGWDRAHISRDRVRQSVKEYGARGDGVTDDTRALQSALNGIRPGEILIVSPGEYRFTASLTFSVNNAIVLGDRAFLIAQTPNNEALNIKGDGSAVIGLGLRGAKSARLNTPASAQLVVMGNHDQVVDNDIAGSASGGIFVYGGRGFRIAGNKVHDTMADGIHMTHGAANGLVQNNTVWNTGDDRIAVVSYSNENNPADVSGLVKNILIENNDVSGGSWGRGITVVGGDTVVIRNNAVSDVKGAAGILIAQEASYHTFGSQHILVGNNKVTHIETAPLPPGQQYTHQGAIDVNSSGEMPVGDIHIENNTIDGAGFSGIRVLANICNVSISGNHLFRVQGQPIQIQPSTCPDTLLYDNNAADKPIQLGSSHIANSSNRFIEQEAEIIRAIETRVEDCSAAPVNR